MSVEVRVEDLAPVKELCLRSTYAFGKFVCGFLDFDGDVHGRMGAWVDDEGSRFKLGQAPRGFFKTSTWTIANKLRRVTVDPNLRVLLSNEIADNTSKWIGLMQAIVMSPLYRALFPDRVPDLQKGKYRWNSTQLELKRSASWPEPTIEGIGVGGASTSNHYDIIVNDDLVGKEARESPLVMAKAIDHRKLCWSLMKDASKSEIHDYGTRWHVHDVIDWVLKNVRNVDGYLLDIYREDGTPQWPSRYPEPVIEQIRQEQGAEMFALQYRNKAVGGGASKFDPQMMRYWTSETDEKGESFFRLERPGADDKVVYWKDCLFFQVIDAGLNPGPDSARTANIVAAITPPTETEPFDIVIVEALATKSLPNDVIHQAHKVYRKWNPLSAHIETFGGHQAFFYWAIQNFPDMRLAQLDKDFSRNAKHKRIISFWGTYPKQGRVYVHRTQVDLMDELVTYGTGGPVDLLDSAAYLPTVWAPPPMATPKRAQRYSAFDLADDLDEKDFIGRDGRGADHRSPFCGY